METPSIHDLILFSEGMLDESSMEEINRFFKEEKLKKREELKRKRKEEMRRDIKMWREKMIRKKDEENKDQG